MSQTTPVSQESRWRRALRGLVRFLVRLVTVALLFLVLALVVYYGIPWLHRNYIQPLYDLQFRVQTLEEEVQRLRGAMDAERQQWEAQLQALEAQQQAEQDRLAALEERLQRLEEALDAQAQYVQALEEEARTLRDYLSQGEAALNALEVRLSDLEALLDRRWPLWQQAQEDVLVTRVMVHLLRAQMYLSQENYTAARGEMAVLTDALSARLLLMPESQLAPWEDFLARIEEAQQALPEKPVEAQKALDAAWNVLMAIGGEEVVPVTPSSPPEGTPMPTPSPTPEG